MATNGRSASTKIGLLLLPKFSMISYASTVETFLLANTLAGKDLYDCVIFTQNDNSVESTIGSLANPDHTLDTATKMDYFFVCGGDSSIDDINERTNSILTTLSNKNIPIGAISSGIYILAKSGLLDGYRCSVHWHHFNFMQDSFPNIIFTKRLFEIDMNRFSCPGGASVVHLIVTLIKNQHGTELASDISETLMLERIRSSEDKQRIPLKHIIGTSHPKLIEAVTLMESNIDEPISLKELSHYVGISTRQLERLFRDNLDSTPTKYYMDLRLQIARNLLINTSKSITNIAQATGFISQSHFSQCYRSIYGISPTKQRQQTL